MLRMVLSQALGGLRSRRGSESIQTALLAALFIALVLGAARFMFGSVADAFRYIGEQISDIW